ncbi:MAG: 4Fe-4S binding protein, partial [Verrucomicrobiota bacterium]
RGGLELLDSAGENIGYVVRTLPEASNVIGYSGPTDSLLVFDENDEVVGLSIRRSYDTPSHVEDVQIDYLFMKTFNGKSWEEISAIEDLREAKIWAVSGASRTSEAVANGVITRLAAADGREVKRAFQFGWRDALLLCFWGGGCAFAFVRSKRLQKWRGLFFILTIGGVGIWLGDLIAQSLVIGWIETRIPWEATPGLVVLVLGAFVVPWFSRQPVYCQFVCPHGNLQRLIVKWTPSKWKRSLNDDGKWVARFAPPMLLAVVLIVSFKQLDFDLAGIEPFDAYLLTSAGTATIVIAVVGLLLSFVFPMAYCRFGCPTGWLLEFIRRRGGKDRFSWRDAVGCGLLLLALTLHQWPIVAA